MLLTKKQFDLLCTVISSDRVLTQRELQEKSGYSLGTINKTVRELCESGYISNGMITPVGMTVMEGYRVKRAVFIAAGYSARLVPVTLNTPKPLVRVHGKRIIDTLLDAVIAAGIEEIYIVRGYLAEQFDQLLYKYPMIRFIENPVYNETNNISSAMCVRFLLGGAYVLEADLLLSNNGIINRYQYSSNFLGIAAERTDDWCFRVKDGIIEAQNVGGTNCFQEVGISYWNEEDGKKLAEHIELVYAMPGGKESYWDQVPFVYFPDAYRVALRECSSDDVTEIDTFRELRTIDKSYCVY